MSGHEFRMAVGRVGGWQLVKSTAFDVERTAPAIAFAAAALATASASAWSAPAIAPRRAPPRTTS